MKRAFSFMVRMFGVLAALFIFLQLIPALLFMLLGIPA